MQGADVQMKVAVGDINLGSKVAVSDINNAFLIVTVEIHYKKIKFVDDTTVFSESSIYICCAAKTSHCINSVVISRIKK